MKRKHHSPSLFSPPASHQRPYVITKERLRNVPPLAFYQFPCILTYRTPTDASTICSMSSVRVNHLFHDFAAVKKFNDTRHVGTAFSWMFYTCACFIMIFAKAFEIESRRIQIRTIDSCRSTNENKCFKINSTRTWSSTLERMHVSSYVFMKMQPIVIQYD